MRLIIGFDFLFVVFIILVLSIGLENTGTEWRIKSQFWHVDIFFTLYLAMISQKFERDLASILRLSVTLRTLYLKLLLSWLFYVEAMEICFIITPPFTFLS
jgi:hypothetical protein